MQSPAGRWKKFRRNLQGKLFL